MDLARPMMNRMAAGSAMFFGIPRSFVPRIPPPHFAAEGTLAALSYYDTEPLRAMVNDGVAAVVAKFGGVDILVSNAGIQIVHPIEEFPFADWKKEES
jgi:NAD(P)-dependent dehydrogenase (short-subunit alcohol dehydrogenase family)